MRMTVEVGLASNWAQKVLSYSVSVRLLSTVGGSLSFVVELGYLSTPNGGFCQWGSPASYCLMPLSGWLWQCRELSLRLKAELRDSNPKNQKPGLIIQRFSIRKNPDGFVHWHVLYTSFYVEKHRLGEGLQVQLFDDGPVCQIKTVV